MRNSAQHLASQQRGPFGFIVSVAAYFLFITASLCLAGCFGIPEAPAVAAYVNGEEILEDDVTAYIEGFRAKNTKYETDTGWAEFLKTNGYTSEGIRSYVLNTNFIPEALIRQQCEARDIQITGAELDQVINQEKAYYEQRYGENSWDSVLASYGFDEDSWRQNELDRLLEEQLMNDVIDNAEPSVGELQALANETASNYNGKSSYYIVYDSAQAAQAARDSLNMIDGTTTLEAFQALGNAVYAGWNSLAANRESLSTEYVQALNSLEVNHVSAPVQQGNSWLLIYCDATFNASASTQSVPLDTIPAEIYDQLVTDATTAKKKNLFSDWLSELAADSDIVYEPMPDGLPYSVNVTLEEG